jgi:hypothetical protein
MADGGGGLCSSPEHAVEVTVQPIRCSRLAA